MKDFNSFNIKDALKNPLFNVLYEANPVIGEELFSSKNIEDARKRISDYLNNRETELLSAESEVHSMNVSHIRYCIRVLRNVLSARSEKLTGFSALKLLWDVALAGDEYKEDKRFEALGQGFWLEFYHLFEGVRGRGDFFRTGEESAEKMSEIEKMTGRSASEKRSDFLSDLAHNALTYMSRYCWGMDPDVQEYRKHQKEKILHYLEADQYHWEDWKWHRDHIFNKVEDIKKIINLSPEEERALKMASDNDIPIGITPYYLSLLEEKAGGNRDRTLRAVVFPTVQFIKQIIRAKEAVSINVEQDYIGERDTSPVNPISRREPHSALFKVRSLSCQIFCHTLRTWEAKKTLIPFMLEKETYIKNAVDWLRERKEINELLLAWGEPLQKEDDAMEEFLEQLSGIPTLYRIKISTGLLSAIPQRITDNLVNIMAKYNEPGKRAINMVLHIESPMELTPEVMTAVNKLRLAGIRVYNQATMMLENSRRFEMVDLKQKLRLLGIDPYYTVIMAGKNENEEHRVPIARALQERYEETGISTGLIGTDELVLDIPVKGKNYIRSGTDHEILMIMPKGSRIYELHPWDKEIVRTKPYLFRDVSIYEYLQRLQKMGEPPEDYKTIWFFY